jgi:hypothetical protein
MLMSLDRELELDFIREFAVGGELPRGKNVDERREHIRVAIYGHNRYTRHSETAAWIMRRPTNVVTEDQSRCAAPPGTKRS